MTFINDDHYFANVAIVQNVFNGACRIFWGFGYDKLGFKTCFLVIGSTVSLVTASLPALPYFGNKNLILILRGWIDCGLKLLGFSYTLFQKRMVTFINPSLTSFRKIICFLSLGEETTAARAMYAIMMVLLYGAFPGMYPIVAAGVNEAFGPLHYKANFGLLFTQSVAYCVILLIIAKIPIIQVQRNYQNLKSVVQFCSLYVGPTILGCAKGCGILHIAQPRREGCINSTDFIYLF